MKKDETVRDLFDALTTRMATAKGEAAKLRALCEVITETCRRDDLTDRAQLNQLAYLSGMATGHLRTYAATIERNGQ